MVGISLINFIQVEDFDLSNITCSLLIYSIKYISDIPNTKYIDHTEYVNDILHIRYIIINKYCSS